MVFIGRFVVARNFFTASSLWRVIISFIVSPLNCWNLRSASRRDTPRNAATSFTLMPFAAFLRMYAVARERRCAAGAEATADSRSTTFTGLTRNGAEDLLCRKKFDDMFCQSNYPVDIHGKKLSFNEKKYKDVDDGKPWYEIPFRSLIVKGADNLMVAGRCFSSSYHANGSARVIGPSMGMGQAAGIVASMFIDKKLAAVRELDGKLVRERMIELGVKLDEAPGGYWKTIREFEGHFVIAGTDWVQIINDKGENPTQM